MKRLLITCTLVALIAVGLSNALAVQTMRVNLPLVSCPGCAGAVPTPAPVPTMPSAPTPDPSAFAGRMVELVNQTRVAAGCPVVTADATLMQAAQEWSSTMATTHSYRHSLGGYYQQAGFPGTTLENIASGGDAPEYALEGWMLSPPHKANIEFCYPTSNPSYDPRIAYKIGVGYDEGYWTLVIGWYIP